MQSILDELTEEIKNNNFFEFVRSKYFTNENDLVVAIATVHNSKIIDVVEFFKTFPNNNNNFYLAKHIFEKVLPSIEHPVIKVMECVDALFKSADGDMTAGAVFQSFMKYCSQKQSYSEEALCVALNSIEDWEYFVSPSIVAGASFDIQLWSDKAIQLILSDQVKVKSQAIIALGEITYDNDITIIKKVILALTQAQQSLASDEINAKILFSTFRIFLNLDSPFNELTELIEAALKLNGDSTIHQTSNIFAFNVERIPNALLPVFLESLKKLKGTNLGTLKNVDIGIYNLLKNKMENEAIALIETLLLLNKTLTIEQFEMTRSQLFEVENSSVLYKIITKWLLSKKIQLLKAIEFLSFSNDVDEPFQLDMTQVSLLSNEEKIFLTRKIVGWLMLRPITATSLLISLMNEASEQVIEEISSLYIYNIMFMNFPNSQKKFVESILEQQGQIVQNQLRIILQKLDSYEQDLNLSLKLLELQPTQSQKETYSRNHSMKMKSVYKKAQEKSIFRQLVRHQLILYSNKTISHIHYGNGEVKREVFPMHTFQASVEYPRLDVLEPHNLDYFIKTFRIEGITE
ncbi:hypothetical protein DTO96_100556 [Ephemeroptericola cinctiostellae]|uniref:Uncharacterized protein n=1 Tax=Ephemeroptericola cinctiostellae TaxID=2268024 RepID=A0A345D908_9BURK|nr:hypothetical protein [Ephemeroptericola cinctiostellae]AXF84846.1 hypothetical protein DTO96_100556 [Ephemeroptericola cinctiostellae]